MTERETAPLDAVVPWVIEFRVVGTHHIIKVPAKEVMLVGRRDERNGIFPELDLSEFAAQALGVSRKHALIEVKQNRVVIVDLESPNGTFINSHVLTANQEYRLRDGDQLKFGRLQLQVHFVVKPTTRDSTQEIDSIEDLGIPRLGNGQLVLVVDEDTQVAKLVEAVCKAAGFNAQIVHTAADGIAAIDDQIPDAMIVELLLPDGNGSDLIHYIRRQVESHQRIPVIAISTATAGYQMGQALREGVDIFMGKPFSVEELVDGLKKVVDKVG